MTAPTYWPATPPVRCQAAAGCHGAQVGDGRGACLAHLNPSELFDWLATLRPGSNLDLRGTYIEAELLARLLSALHNENGYPVLGDAWFTGAKFTGDARFDGAQFTGDAWFDGAQFTADVWFYGAQFTGDARFEGAQFTGDARFDGAQFTEDAWFSLAKFARHAQFHDVQFRIGAGFTHVQFTGEARFHKAQFSGHAGFTSVQFDAEARFNEAQFNADAMFNGAQFTGDAWFSRAQFIGETRFDGAEFTRDARFDGARFALPVVLGLLFVHGTLSLAAASFEDTLVVEALAAYVRLDRTTCKAGAHLQLRYAEVVLDGAQLAQPMTLAAADPFTRHSALAGLGEVALAQPGREPTPRLLSVRAADIANLVVADLSLSPCRFAGAHHLDQLRLEGAIGFARPPRGLQVSRAWPPVWWWTRRQTLAEEHAWRATRPKGIGWHGPQTRPPGWLEAVTGQPPRVIGPERLAGLYRALRQAQENRKNEPGAADFYYGEMEMRRLATTTPWAERVILFAYWLVAGYGLRGLRALATLGVVVVAVAGLFHAVGFLPSHPAPSWWDSLLYTAGSTLSIYDDALKLTAWGKLLRLLLRLVGPILLGLTLLSIRNRVKR